MSPRPEPLPCGTDAAYQRHKRRGQKPCRPCTTAHSADLLVRQRKYRKAERTVRRARATATAQATEALKLRHQAEYDTLYAAALREAWADVEA